MTRQILVSGLAVFALGISALACKSGGVGDPCIPNLEYSPEDQGATATGAQIEDRSFQCETRICLINHFRGRVSCPFGNKGGRGGVTLNDDSLDNCYVPGTNQLVTADIKPQCKERKDNVYCSCRCDGTDTAAKYCECPSGFKCEEVTSSLDESVMRSGDKYCVRAAPFNNSSADGDTTCTDCSWTTEKCGYSENKQTF